MRLLIAAFLLTACSDPFIGAGIGFGPNGASVRPVISGTVPGGGRVSYSP